ncbi:MAG: translocation/assembly module TamB domain-containing protein [Candidatus Tectimicrobiota bacterium]
MGRRLGKIALYLTLILLGLGLLVYGTVINPVYEPLRDALVNRVARQISQALNGSLEIGALRGSLFSAPVLHNVVLRDPQGRVLGQIESIRLSYTLTTLLSGRLDVHTVDIVRPQLHIAQEPDGSLNLLTLLPASSPPPQEPPASGSGLPFAVHLETLRIRDGQLTLDLPALPGVQQVDDLQALARVQLDQDGLHAALQQLSARTSPAAVDLSTGQGTVQIRGNTVHIGDLRLQTGATLITAHGTLPGGEGAADFTLHTQPLALAEIGRLLHKEALREPLHMTLQVSGPPEAMQVQGQVRSAAAEMDLQGQLHTAAQPWRYNVQFQVAHLDLQGLTGRADLQSDLNLQLHLQGEGVTLQELRSTLQIDVQASHLGPLVLRPSAIHVEALQQRFQVHRFALDTSVAHITASGALDLAGTSDLQYGLTTDLAGLRQLVGVADLAGTLQLQGQASGTWPALRTQGRLTAQQLLYQGNSLQALQLTYDGTQLGAQPQVQAHLQAQQLGAGSLPVAQLDLEATYTDADRQVRFALDVRQAANAGGKTHGTLTLGSTEQQLVLDALLIQLPDRLWQSTAPLQVAFGPQDFQIQQLQLAHAEESLHLSGRFAGAHFQDVQVQVTQLDLSYLQQLLQLPAAVGGRVTLHAQLTGTLAEPQLHSELTLRSTPQQPLPFTQLHTTFAYAQQRLQGEVRLQQASREALRLDLQLPIDLALTSMPLAQRLIEAPVEVRLSLTQLDLAALYPPEGALPRLTGTLQGTVLSLEGTYTALQLHTDLQLRQLGVQDVVENLQGQVRLRGAVSAVPANTTLAQALQQGQLQPQLHDLVLRIPQLQGHIPARDTAPQPFQVQDLVVQGSAGWTAAGLRANLQRLHFQGTGFGMPRTDVLLEARATPERLDLTRLQIRLPQSELQAQGWFTFPGQQLQVRCDIPRLQLSELPMALPAALPQLLQGRLTARGSLQAPQVEADLRYAGGQVRADLLAQLQEAVPRYQASVRLSGLDLGQLLPGAQGRLQASARLQGAGVTLETRRASLELTLDTEGFTPAPGLLARLQATLAGDTLQIARLQVRSTVLDLVANGTLSASKQTALDYRLTLGDLQPLSRYLGMPLQARGSLTGSVQGNRGMLRTQAALQLHDGQAAEWRLPRLQADFTADSLLTTPRGTLKAQVSDLQGPGLLPTSLRLEVVHTPQQDNFTIAVTKGPYEKSTLVGALFPTATAQRLRLQTVRLQHRTLLWENAAPVELVRQQQGQVQVQRLVMRSGSQELTVQGNIVPDGPVQADVQLRQIRLRPTVQAFAPTAEVPDGRLNLSATIRGTVQQPRVQGELHLTALQWQQQHLGELHATLGMQDDTLRADVRWQEQERQILRLSGTAGLPPQAPLNLQVQMSSFDISRLASMTPAVTRSAGSLDLDLHLSGTRTAPQIRGHLALQDGALQVAATGEYYRDIQVRLLAERNRLDIAQFQVGSRTGPLHISGQIQHADFALRSIDLHVQAQNFTVIHTPAIEAVIAADVQAQGPQDALTAHGTVRVPRARIVINKLPGSGPKVVEPWELTVQGVYGRERPDSTRRSTAAEPMALPALLSSLQANIRLDIPKNVWLQGPGTAVEMSGDLQVTKARGAPFIISGTVNTVRGFASFYGKKFELTQGQLTFTGSPEMNPLLDVTVTRKVSDYLVNIHAGGKALEPEIMLSSTPPLEQADIISLLIIGKTTDKLTSSEQGSLGQQAQQIVGSALASQLEGAAGQALGLDTVELSTEGAKVGRYITQDIFLSYERDLGGKDRGNTVGAEYSISPRLKLKGSSSESGETALDLFWQRDY